MSADVGFLTSQNLLEEPVPGNLALSKIFGVPVTCGRGPDNGRAAGRLTPRPPRTPLLTSSKKCGGGLRFYQETAQPPLASDPPLAARPAGTQFPLTITPAGASPVTYRAMASWAAVTTWATDGQPVIVIWSVGSRVLLVGSTGPAHPPTYTSESATAAAGIQLPLTTRPAGWSPAAYWPMACCAAASTCVDDKQTPVRTIWSDGRAGGGLVGLAARATPPRPRTSGKTMIGTARNLLR